MTKFEFDHLEDLTYRVIHQVHDDIIVYLQSEKGISQDISWEKVLNDVQDQSIHEFVFNYDLRLDQIIRESFIQADLNGRKIKKASVLYDKEFLKIEKDYPSEYFDQYNAEDFKKAAKYALVRFYELLREW